MKKAATAAILAAALFGTASGVAVAQIPVTVTSDIPGIANHVETIAKWTSQLDQMRNQLEQAKQQYSALTGKRNLGEILNNPQLREYLPKDWQQVYDTVRKGGLDGLTGDGLAIYKDNQVFDMCASISTEDAKKACQSAAAKPAQDKANALAGIDKAMQRVGQIEGLMKQINGTTDPKAIAELGARINAEQAAIQNEQTKLSLFQMVAQAEDKLREQRQREINAKANARKGYAKLPAAKY